MTSKKRVAILGGGGGAIAAAMELTATQALRDAHEITVYTPGWRLGGKAASGRNAAKHERIEEHGLHVLFGFYDNAFQLVQEAYNELNRPAGDPLATWQEAFTPNDNIVFFDIWKGKATGHQIDVPTNGRVPGQTHGFDLDDLATFALDVAMAAAKELFGHGESLGYHQEGVRSTTKPEGILGWLRAAVDAIRRLIGKGEQLIEDEVRRLLGDLEAAIERDIGRGLKHGLEGILTTLRRLKDAFYQLWVKHHLDNDRVRFLFTSIDLVSTVISGIVMDDLVGKGFAHVNGEELKAWMHRHGATDVTLQHSPLLRALYDLTFAFEEGDTDRPNLAAGQALEAMIRIATQYKGHIMYKMNAGMGDTIFGPFYEVLKARGVTFEFFHWVDKLGVDPTAERIDSIDLFQQTVPDANYQYLVDVKGLPCWPSEPDWSQLEDGAKLQAQGVDLEHTPNPLGKPVTTLRRGTDFDEVVLGIAAPALPSICEELTDRNPRFASMLSNSSSVATQAVQVWSTKTVPELGWQFAEESISTGYFEPIDTYCNLTHLLEREKWAPGEVSSLGYFCGPLAENPNETHDEAVAGVRQRAIDMFDNKSADLWPDAQTSRGFDWDVMYADSSRSGSARFDDQYWRANTQGSERYVQTLAGSVQYRLWPHESGFTNLKLAGDWTRNGIDGGAFEAAVASGRLAARAITGSSEPVPGTRGIFEDHPGARSQANFIEFGGLNTFPGPYNCKNTTLYSFVVKAGHDELKALINKVFTEPTLGEREFMPLAPYVMLSLGAIENVIPETPPFNTMGSVYEAQVAVWVPVVEVTEENGERKAKLFWMFTSYIWVDNPMSMATGREVYGWPKSLGEIHLPDDKDPAFHLKTYGLDFGPNNQPAYHDLMELTPTGTKVSAQYLGDSLPELAKAFLATISDAGDDHIELTWDIGADLIDDVVMEAVPELFMKQFRGIENGTVAPYQVMAESDARVESISFASITEQYALKIHLVDSHPLAVDLGIKDQVLLPGIKVEMDFVQEVGNIIWSYNDPS